MAGESRAGAGAAFPFDGFTLLAERSFAPLSAAPVRARAALAAGARALVWADGRTGGQIKITLARLGLIPIRPSSGGRSSDEWLNMAANCPLWPLGQVSADARR